MSSTKEEIAPMQTKERLDEEASLQNTLIVQEPLLAAPAVHYRRGGSMSKSKLVARLDRELAIVTTNMRAISKKNPAM